MGSGPEREKLLALKKELNVENVFFFDSVSKNKMPLIIADIDVAVIPLKRLDLFKGAIPSKIFENLAMKKPILLGVEGEAKELFIDEGKCGLAFIPEDEIDLKNKAIEFFENNLQLTEFGENGYLYVKQKFTRDEIAGKFYDFLIRNHEK